MQVLDLFSGAGMFARAFTLEGYSIGAFCEIDPFCREVLAGRFPGVPIFHDVQELTHDQLRAAGADRPDVITAGWPCQGFSVAGEGRGLEDERSGLFGEIIRLADVTRPRYLVLENVPTVIVGNGGRWGRHILRAIATLGYDAEWHVLPAGAPEGLSCGAPHRRDRVWIVAHPSGQRLGGGLNVGAGERGGKATPPAQVHPRHQGLGGATHPIGKRGRGGDASGGHAAYAGQLPRGEGSGPGGLEGVSAMPSLDLLADGIAAGLVRHSFPPEPPIARASRGVPDRAHRLRALGNGLVVPMARAIARAIKEREGAR